MKRERELRVEAEADWGKRFRRERYVAKYWWHVWKRDLTPTEDVRVVKWFQEIGVNFEW